MNYIKEINAFYDWLELNELSQSGVLLWFALMHLNNKSGWQESFTAARSVIEAKSKLGKDAYYSARNQLRQKGLIDFKERKNKATIFRLNSLLSDKQTANPTATPTADTTANPTATPTITKLNETKRNKNSGGIARAEASGFFARNFNNHSPYIHEKIEHWENDLSPEIVIASMKIALEKNAKHFNFCEAILQEWSDNGLKTIDDVRAYETDKKSRMKKPGKRSQPRRVEQTPKWMQEQDKPKQPDDPETEQLRQQLERKLRGG